MGEANGGQNLLERPSGSVGIDLSDVRKEIVFRRLKIEDRNFGCLLNNIDFG